MRPKTRLRHRVTERRAACRGESCPEWRGSLLFIARRIALLVAFVALSCLDRRCGVPLAVLSQGPSHVLALFEMALPVASDIPLIAAGVDQFPICRLLTFRSCLC